MDETKIIAGVVSRIIGQLELEALARIYNAKKLVVQANSHLGLNTQVKAFSLYLQTKHEAIESLPDYAKTRIAHEIKLAARELEALTNG